MNNNFLKTTALFSFLVLSSTQAMARQTDYLNVYVVGVNVNSTGLIVKLKGGLSVPQILCTPLSGVNNGPGLGVVKTNPIYDEAYTLLLSAKLTEHQVNLTFDNDAGKNCEIIEVELKES